MSIHSFIINTTGMQPFTLKFVSAGQLSTIHKYKPETYIRKLTLEAETAVSFNVKQKNRFRHLVSKKTTNDYQNHRTMLQLH
jgi:hypothetical protein